MTNTNEKLITVKELAERWQVSESKVYMMKDAGEITHVLIGKSIRFPASEIMRYEKRNLRRGA